MVSPVLAFVGFPLKNIFQHIPKNSERGCASEWEEGGEEGGVRCVCGGGGGGADGA